MEPEHEDVDWQSSLNICPPAPANVPLKYFAGKDQMLQGLKRSYQSEMQPFETPRAFGAIHQSTFSLLGPEAIDTVTNDPTKLRGVGDTIQSVVNYFITGAIPKQAAAAANTAPPHDHEIAGAVETPAEEEPATSSGAEENLVSRTLGTVRGTLLRFSRKRTRSGPSPEAETPDVKKLSSQSMPKPRPESPAAKGRPKDRSKKTAFIARHRDKYQCLFTFNEGGIDAAHILPHAMNSAEDHISFFSAIVPHLTTMFGETFVKRLNDLVGARGASDRPWNVITLNTYVHRLYDIGLIGFRPKKITKHATKADNRFGVHFSIHWLWKTKLLAQHEVSPTTSSILDALDPTQEYELRKTHYDIYNTVAGTPVRDGTVVCVLLNSLEDAQMMYECLATSWAMRMILFYAGAAGFPDGDVQSDERFRESEETEGFWDQTENHEAIINEYFGQPAQGNRRPSF